MPGLLVHVSVGTARAAWLALIALQLAWFAWLAPAQVPGRLGGTLFAVVPLLLPAWWILRLHLNGLVVGGLILLGYFCFAVVEAWVSPDARALALVQIGLVAIYYLGLLSVRRGVTKAAGDNTSDR